MSKTSKVFFSFKPNRQRAVVEDNVTTQLNRLHIQLNTEQWQRGKQPGPRTYVFKVLSNTTWDNNLVAVFVGNQLQLIHHFTFLVLGFPFFPTPGELTPGRKIDELANDRFGSRLVKLATCERRVTLPVRSAAFDSRRFDCSSPPLLM